MKSTQRNSLNSIPKQYFPIVMGAFKAAKYYLIIMQSMVTNRTVVTFFGSSYAVAGNTVRRLGGKPKD